MKDVKRIGPRTEPRGTPVWSNMGADRSSPCLTNNDDDDDDDDDVDDDVDYYDDDDDDGGGGNNDDNNIGRSLKV